MPEAGSPPNWLRYARSDLLLAGILPPEGSAHYAVVSRYPGDYEPATAEDWQEAVRIAQAVDAWAARLIGPDRA
jgi:hypothetical protein